MLYKGDIKCTLFYIIVKYFKGSFHAHVVSGSSYIDSKCFPRTNFAQDNICGKRNSTRVLGLPIDYCS